MQASVKFPVDIILTWIPPACSKAIGDVLPLVQQLDDPGWHGKHADASESHSSLDAVLNRGEHRLLLGRVCCQFG